MSLLALPPALRLALEAVLLLAAAPVLLAALYLLLLTLLSRRAPAPAPATPRLRFDVVIPAHNEEAGIARTVKNVRALAWPAELFRVTVVADNCADGTAAVAAGAGARVLERVDLERRGKGYALELAFGRSLQEGFADAVVVVDADTEVSPNLLAAFQARIERGAPAVQAHYGVLNPQASWRTRLMVVALGMFHQVRSLGRERLGVSCGLRGNGMCFTRATLERVPHTAFSLVEDLEYGVRLGQAGLRVHYAGEAHVLGEMVSGEKASRSQRQRWEGGRAAMARQVGLPLLRDGLRRRDGLLLDLAADVLVPPLAQLTLAAAGGLVACAGAWALLGAGAPALGAFALALAALGAYVLRGWWVSGVGPRGLVDLAFVAPAYVVWKVALKLRPGGGSRGEWVRTTREGEVRR